MIKREKSEEVKMKKTNSIECDNKIAVDIAGLQAMLSCGKNTADKIGEQAGAVIRIGKRKLFNVEKIKEHMNKLTEE